MTVENLKYQIKLQSKIKKVACSTVLINILNFGIFRILIKINLKYLKLRNQHYALLLQKKSWSK